MRETSSGKGSTGGKKPVHSCAIAGSRVGGRDASEQLVAGLIEQCEHPLTRSQTIIPSKFIPANNLDASVLKLL